MNSAHPPAQFSARTPERTPLKIGVGGPVGSGKTALLEALCREMRVSYQLAVITNDIYTFEDQLILTRAAAISRTATCRN